MSVIFLCLLLSVFWTPGKVHETRHVDAWPEMRTETFWTKLKLKEGENWDWHKHRDIKYIYNMYPYVWRFMLTWWHSIDWWLTEGACHRPWINLKIRLKTVLFSKWPVIWHCVCNARQWHEHWTEECTRLLWAKARTQGQVFTAGSHNPLQILQR